MASASPYHIDAPFLVDVMEALRLRGKALRHKGATPAIHRAIEFQSGSPCARIEILFRQRRNQMLSIHLWEDRAISIYAGEAIRNRGWLFRYDNAGRFPGPNEGSELVKAAEASLSAMFEMTEATTDRLETIWRPLIAKGPKLV